LRLWNMKIHGVFPIIKSSFFGGLRIELIIFTDEAVVRIENVEEITRGISPLSSGIKTLRYGLSGRARRFMEWMRSLKGRELGLEDVRRLGKKAIVVPYTDVTSIKVSKGITITLEVKARSRKLKDRIALGLYKEVKMSRDEVYEEVKNTLKGISVLSGKLSFSPP
jgi:hypothetical protein